MSVWMLASTVDFSSFLDLDATMGGWLAGRFLLLGVSDAGLGTVSAHTICVVSSHFFHFGTLYITLGTQPIPRH